MKTVFDNRQCVHIWAQQNQSNGRSSNGNLFFEGKTIYSYGYHFPLASFATNDTVLINSDSYSVSTSKHQGYVRQSVNHKNRISVCSSVLKHFISERGFGKSTQHALAQSALSEVNSLIEKAAKRKARKYAAQDILEAQGVLERAEHIFTYFDAQLPKDFIKAKKSLNNKDAQELIAFEKKRQEKIELERKAKYELDQAIYRAECLKWINNEETEVSVFGCDKIFLRINGDEIETTKGARFPIEHAKKAFRAISTAKENSYDYEREYDRGFHYRLGHFTIDKIDAQGNVKAGCHFVEWDEIERIAKILKIYP